MENSIPIENLPDNIFRMRVMITPYHFQYIYQRPIKYNRRLSLADFLAINCGLFTDEASALGR